MANGIELAKAYVQIVPSADGIQGSISRIMGGEASSAGESAGTLLGTKLVGTLKKVIAAAGIGKMISDSLNLGGALQQSIGGIETLFGAGGRSIEEYAKSVGKSVDAVKDEYASLMQSQQTVFDNAAQAYRTVGLSANEYMEQTTSFAASLLSSVSKDTNAAAQLANMAMVDMADNANKMGTDMASIQNAYQGFAKQNYTMLDNLKLGYGGTQAEMQRLLTDAEKLSGVHYELGNLADMYSAIHIIQTDLDITGTTAKEAATTLTGSFAAMKAAAQNVLGDWSTGADLTAPMQALADTTRTFLQGNLLPMIGNVLAGIPQLVYGLVPEVLQTGTELVSSLAAGFAQGIPAFLSTALPQLLSFTEELRANAGQFVDAGLNCITQLLNGLIAGLPQLIAYVPDIIINIAGIINDNMPKILSTGVNLVVALVKGIFQAVPALLANWQKILQAILSVISAVNWVNIGGNILKSIGDGVKNMGSALLNSFKSAFSHPLEWLKGLLSKMHTFGKNVLKSFTDGLSGKSGITNMVTFGTMGITASENASAVSLTDWASSNTSLGSSAQTMAEIAIPAYTKSGSAAAAAASKTATAASVVSSYADTVTEVLGKVTRTTQTTDEVLSNGQKQQKQTITETSRQLVNGVLKDIKTVTTIGANGKKTVQQTMETVRELASSVTSTSEALVDGIRTATQTVTETLTDGTESQKQTITKTYTAIIDGALRTVKEVKTIAADGTEQVAKTLEEASSKNFSGLLQGWKKEADKGVLGTFSTLISAVKSKDWKSIGQWVLSTLYNGLAPESQKLIDDFGLNLIQQLNKALGDKISDISQKAWDIGSSIADGIAKGLGNALGKDGGVQDILNGLNINISDVGSKIMGVLGTMGTSMGNFAVNAGTKIAGLAGSMGSLGTIAESVGGLIANVGSLIISNPEVAAIIAIVAGVVALGVALFAKFGKGKSSGTTSTQKAYSYKDIQDAYWYGNERAFAGYDYRTDPYVMNPDNNAMLAYQAKMQAQMERLYGVVEKYLPEAGNSVIALDGEQVGRIITPSVNRSLGDLTVLSERGN